MPEWLSAPVVLAFLGTSAVAMFLFQFLESDPGRSSGVGLLLGRRRNLRVGELALAALPRLGTPLIPAGKEAQSRLQQRLIHAGLYSQSALPRFLGVRAVLLAVAVLAAVAFALSDLLPLMQDLVIGTTLVGLAFLGPGLWLDWKTRNRLASFRRALPDVMDILIICLEAGIGVQEAIRRVAEELQTAHPLLSEEFTIVQREMLLGLSAGESLSKLAARADLAEARNLASVILYAERYGVSTVNAMRVEADAMRLTRQQRAEEMAQKAAVKVLFPTLLLIFPALFIVVLGPAAYGIIESLATMK
jgi:tight adherence protein C